MCVDELTEVICNIHQVGTMNMFPLRFLSYSYICICILEFVYLFINSNSWQATLACEAL